MPAVLDDPASPTIYRVSGQPPYPDPNSPGFPADMLPKQVTLRDRQTVATIVPFASRHQVPPSLLAYLCDQLNKEIDGGDTYPMTEPFSVDAFSAYWFQNFGAVMLLGSVERPADVVEGKDWARECLGSFYIKPNYPGRSSHVCNAGFIVTGASRNRGVGRLMGEAYLDWAPRLGYAYSVFNLVYETNVASCRIWDGLGFKRIGRVKGCGNLRSHPGQLVDAIIYGRDLTPRGTGEGGDDLVSEERFDKIKFYLKYGEYPSGADRAEKSRLRSAATHYKLLEGDKLMLKDKEVISDPARQFDIARRVHVLQHAGINKTTATIAEKYHWSRIKETVSDVIRSCVDCRELGKMPNPGGARRGGGGVGASAAAAVASSSSNAGGGGGGGGSSGGMAPGSAVGAGPSSPAPVIGPSGRVLPLQEPSGIISGLSTNPAPDPSPFANPADISLVPALHQTNPLDQALHVHSHHHQHHHHQPQSSSHHHHHHHSPTSILQDGSIVHSHPVYQPIDPQIINQASPHDHLSSFDQYHSPADFQALLNATEDDVVVVVVPGENDAVDRDLAMLIDHQDDDDDVEVDVDVLSDPSSVQGLDDAKVRGLYEVNFEPPDAS